MVAWVFPDFELMWLAEETKKNLPRELDFSQEAQNAERVADMFKHFAWLRVRSIYIINEVLSCRGGYREGRPGAAAPPCILA